MKLVSPSSLQNSILAQAKGNTLAMSSPTKVSELGRDRIKTIVDLPTPTTTTDLRSLLGFASFVRTGLPEFATVKKPLVARTRIKACRTGKVTPHWGSKQDAPVAHVNHLLTFAHFLHFPDFSQEFGICVAAIDLGGRGVLEYVLEKDLHISAYYSHKFDRAKHR